ncbi:hypothetical protein [Zobellia russellii]|uniref:hypothetical protein n=1 Tax=Zobellia russellii TaxID=248907 RepID=UPI001BFFB34E|nr:hypothetical protein [Zobellia russellii]MBT9187818.1 hypothetical protein [Zobellia russellii]
MHKKRTIKIISRIILVLLVLVALTLLGAQLLAKDAIANFLKTKLPPHIQLAYEDIDVNVLTGTTKLNTIDLNIGISDSIRPRASAKIEVLEVVGLGYWQFLFNKKITLTNINVDKPVVKYYLKGKEDEATKSKNDSIGLKKSIHIDHINIKNGSVTLFKNPEDSVAMKLDSVFFEMDEVVTDRNRINSKIPVAYSDVKFNGNSLYADLGPYEALNVNEIHLDQGHLRVTDLKLKSKYSKTKLSAHLRKEHDYIDLKIPQVDFDEIAFGYADAKYWVRTGKGTLQGPNLEMYRDKLVADDLERKKMYSEAIRKLPIQLDVPEIQIQDGAITYSERVNRETTPGKIIFGDVNAKIVHIQNVPERKEKTSLAANALLMGEAPITLNWSFDAKNNTDAFLASGTVKSFSSKNINPFLESNLRVRAKGEIQELYFTISGDAVSSAGDMKMKYEDFEFSVLKKDRLSINKVLTSIGRIFVNDGSNTDENGYRYGGIEAERDPTKSFFNYLWLNVNDGLTSTIIGNGKNKRRKN